jgi:hypothetical protein
MQFLGGILVGLAFGMPLGAYLVEGEKEPNYTKLAGIGAILAVAGVATARVGASKS